MKAKNLSLKSKNSAIIIEKAFYFEAILRKSHLGVAI